MFPDIRAHPPSSDNHLSLNGKINDLMHLRGQNNHILKKQRTWPKIGPAPSEKVTSCVPRLDILMLVFVKLKKFALCVSVLM